MNQSLFVFFESGCKGCRYCSIHSVPLTVIKFLIIFMFVEFLIKKFFQSCSARTGFTPMSDKSVDLRRSQCKQSSWSGLCMSSPSPLHRLITQHFDERYKRKQNDSFLREPEHTIWVSRHRTLRSQYLHLVVFLWKQYIILASYNGFCKL